MAEQAAEGCPGGAARVLRACPNESRFESTERANQMTNHGHGTKKITP